MSHSIEALLFDTEQISSCISHELNDLLKYALKELNNGGSVDAAKAHIEHVIRRNTILRDYTYLMQNSERVTEISFDALFHEAQEELHELIGSTGATISCETLPTVQGRKRQWSQCFYHLLKNALMYHGDAPPNITVTTTHDDQWITIHFRDEGIGIRPALAPLAFGLFRRINPNDGIEAEGCGLTICKRVVENHGGQIKLDTQPTQYSRFTLILPASLNISAD